jgi:hypothetical protein
MRSARTPESRTAATRLAPGVAIFNPQGGRKRHTAFCNITGHGLTTPGRASPGHYPANRGNCSKRISSRPGPLKPVSQQIVAPMALRMPGSASGLYAKHALSERCPRKNRAEGCAERWQGLRSRRDSAATPSTAWSWSGSRTRNRSYPPDGPFRRKNDPDPHPLRLHGTTFTAKRMRERCPEPTVAGRLASMKRAG